MRVQVTDRPLLSCQHPDWGAERRRSASAARCSSESEKKHVAELKTNNGDTKPTINIGPTIALIYII